MRYNATLDQLHEMLGLIREEAKKAGFDDSEVYRIELASEEALVNIINYAYVGGNGTIELICDSPSKRQLKITLKDQGKPFNPLEGEQPVDPEASMQQRAVGGLGVFLMRRLMDEVAYAREGDTNVLTLVMTETPRKIQV